MAVFDHVISDAVSSRIFARAVREVSSARNATANSFDNWVAWQRQRFPMHEAPCEQDASFWRRYLNDTQPDRPAELSFQNPNAAIGVAFASLHRPLSVSPAALGAAASRLRVSPSILLMASVASALGDVGDATDLTLRVNTVGRPSAYSRTYGLFANNIPVRVADRGLSEPNRSLIATTQAWLEVLPHFATPWDYIRRIAANSLGYTPSLVERPAQVLINIVPWPVEFRQSQLRSQEKAGSLGTLQFLFVIDHGGQYHVRCEFDPARFERGAVTACLSSIIQNVARFVHT
jgi:hypothetical protein